MTGPPVGPGVSRDHYRSGELDEVEAFLRATYTELSLHRPGDGGDEQSRFWLEHDTVAAAGTGVAINHLSSTLTLDATVPPRDYVAVDDLQRGRMSWSTRDGRQERFAAGALAVAPVTDAEFRHTLAAAELDIVVLDTARVGDYAAHVCGLSDAAPRFTGAVPLSTGLGEHWRTTVAHVRDDVLAHPDAADNPIICETAFRLLASTLLSTFPNTALDTATDPTRAQETGHPDAVGEEILRRVVDYLHTHAGDPLGPGDVAEVADVPYREVAAGLRRRHGTDPARLLWHARLRGARRDLLDTDPAAGHAPPESVAEAVAAVAARWGFTHPGTFTAAYTQATGEAPEDTLRRG